MRADPKSATKTDSLTVIFQLLGTAFIKASINMLVKSTPGGALFRLSISPKMICVLDCWVTF